MRPLVRLVPLAALLAAAACSDRSASDGDSTTADAAPGGTVIIAAAGDADNLVPGLATSNTSHQVIDLVFDRLAEIGDSLNITGDGGFEPHLARRWTWAPDSLSIAFELDPRARWHDGRPVRASDVRFSYMLHRNPALASQIAPLIAEIDSVTVRDSLTVVVWWSQRSPQQFFQAVRHTPILPEHVYGSVAPGELRVSAQSRAPVGSGRFRLARWEPGTRLELVADTANYKGRALLDRVVWTFTADPNGLLARVTAGEADFTEAVPPARAAGVDSLPNIRVFAYPGNGYAFMGMNLQARRGGTAPHPIFGDVRVRRALTMATDRRAMLANVFGTYGMPSYGPFPAAMDLSDTTIAQLPFDTAAAAALLDSAGWRAGPGGIRQKDGTPLRFSLLVPQSSAARMQYAVLLQEQFKRAGADAQIETADFASFVNRSQDRNYDAALQGWGTDPGAAGFRERWGSDGAKSGGQNVEGYRSQAMDAHVDSALATYDFPTARRHMRAAFQQIIADAPGIWLYDIVPLAAIHERIRTPKFRGDGKWWVDLADWWIPADARIPRDQVGLRPAAAQ